MALPVSYHTITLADNTKKSNGEPETTSTRFPVITLTPANAAATITLMGNLRTALASLVIGRFVKNSIIYAENQTGPQTPADSVLAQRENKWLLRYHDAVTYQKFQVSVGTADLTALPATNTEFLDLTAGDGLALKTAFEAVVVSPADAANSVVLDSVQFVGRNS